jgi:hypothetical protein
MSKPKTDDSSALAPAPPSAVALPSAFLEDANLGHEDVRSSDLAIPYLGVIQALSPQLDDSKGEYIEGAKAGDIFLSTSKRCWKGRGPDAGILFVPAAFQARWNEWTPRTEGGGFVRAFDLGEKPPRSSDRDIRVPLANGNEAVLSHYHYVVVVDFAEGTYERAVAALQSTQIKHSKALNTILLSLRMRTEQGAATPPRFASVVRGSVVEEANAKGKWWGWHFDRTRYLDLAVPFEAEVYADARAFHADIRAGATLPPPPAASETEPAADGDVPF